MYQKGERIPSDRQKALSIFLQQLQQSEEKETGERVTVHSTTKTDGGKILEIVMGENPLFAPVVSVEAPETGYEKNELESIS